MSREVLLFRFSNHSKVNVYYGICMYMYIGNYIKRVTTNVGMILVRSSDKTVSHWGGVDGGGLLYPV